MFSAFIHSVPTTKWVSRLICLLNDFGTLPDSSRLSTLLLLTPPRRVLLAETEVNKVRVFCGTGNIMNICRKACFWAWSSYHISVTSILILSLHLYVGLYWVFLSECRLAYNVCFTERCAPAWWLVFLGSNFGHYTGCHYGNFSWVSSLTRR